MATPPNPIHGNLTNREKQVLRLKLATPALTSRQIAEELGISYATIKGMMKRIHEKLHTSDPLDAAKRAKSIGQI